MSQNYKITYECDNCKKEFEVTYEYGERANGSATCPKCGVKSAGHIKTKQSIKENSFGNKQILKDWVKSDKPQSNIWDSSESSWRW